jgi:exonuclease III
LGGDSDASFDCSLVNDNIDVFNMANIPSTRPSNHIRELCTALNLTDPYRNLYPNTREYTLIPSGDMQHNRSRLDFFIISRELPEQVKNVVIPHSLSSTVFDHKRDGHSDLLFLFFRISHRRRFRGTSTLTQKNEVQK